MRKRFIILIIFSLTAGLIIAGDMDPTDTPVNTQSYSLDDLYNRLESGAAGSQSAFTEPGAAPGVTMRTLNDIMSIAPAVHGNPADASDVVDGKYFWSLMSGQWGLTEGTRALSPVPKSGQIVSYYSDDDGELQKGLEWPNPRFTDNNNGTVTDNLTGLVWLKNAGCMGNTHWWTAIWGCTVLNAGWETSCNLDDGSIEGDWRLPNVRELQSLLNYGSSEYLPVGHPFSDFQHDYYVGYWTSTTDEVNDYNAYIVDFVTGETTSCEKSDDKWVWPVRDSE